MREAETERKLKDGCPAGRRVAATQMADVVLISSRKLLFLSFLAAFPSIFLSSLFHPLFAAPENVVETLKLRQKKQQN